MIDAADTAQAKGYAEEEKDGQIKTRRSGLFCIQIAHINLPYFAKNILIILKCRLNLSFIVFHLG